MLTCSCPRLRGDGFRNPLYDRSEIIDVENERPLSHKEKRLKLRKLQLFNAKNLGHSRSNMVDVVCEFTCAFLCLSNVIIAICELGYVLEKGEYVYETISKP